MGMENKPIITGVTISCEFGVEGEYGKGTKSWMSMSGKFPEPGVAIENIEDVVESGLDMYLAAWKTLLTGRCATGIMGGKEWKQKLLDVEARISKLREHLKKMTTDSVQE